MHMNKRRELIDRYKELWVKYVKQNPDLGFLDGVLRQTCGLSTQYGDKIEQFPVLMIPVTELGVFGTDCGKTPEAYKVFGEQGIAEFLVGFEVDFVFGCIRNDEDVDIAHVGIPLSAIAFQAGSASERIGEAFEYMVNEYGGGLRYEDYQNWCIFESE